MKVIPILIVGDKKVGKTAFVVRAIGSVFNHKYKPTIGVDFGLKKLGETLYQLWDVSGEELNKPTQFSLYHRSTKAIIFCVDPTNAASFPAAKKWHEALKKAAPTDYANIPKFIVYTKMDLKDRQIPYLDSKLKELQNAISATRVFKCSSQDSTLEYASEAGVITKAETFDPVFTSIEDSIPEDKSPHAAIERKKPVEERIYPDSYYELTGLLKKTPESTTGRGAKEEEEEEDDDDDETILVDQIIRFLEDYVRPESVPAFLANKSQGLARILAGHWKRHYVDRVNELVRTLETMKGCTVQDCKEALTKSLRAALLEGTHEDGSLSRRINFIMDKIIDVTPALQSETGMEPK